ncbi:major facilitator superfamily domain-containing protein [Limtongia smithiae]|uniref:major facilitator superfamily domain-containing protein n=1 Tax=Limtongia smithiae TaxID=1125753 RepID=UPI0034CE2C1F
MGFDYFMNPVAEALGWFPKEYSREERVLVNKLDFLILIFACLSTWTNNLDVNAIYNAYESGMEDDLNLFGNRLTYLSAVYWSATTFFQVPSNILITMVPAHYYIPACEIAWGLFTLGTAFVKNYQQLMVMRFFVGITSTPCWVGNVHIINSWYRKKELGKRNAVYYVTYPLGSMFSGYLQNACLNLHGVGGLEGWRWLFIMCTVITIPIATVGYFFYPNVPDHCNSRWLTPREKELARARLLEEGFAPSKGITKRIVIKGMTSWQAWVFFFLCGLFWQTPYPSTTPYLLWLGDQPQYSTAMVNNLSTTSYAISIISAMLCAFYSDWRNKRWDTLLISAVIVLVCNVLLLVWNIPIGAKFFAFIFLGFTQGPINVIIAWLAEVTAYDLEMRSVVLGFVNMSYTIAQIYLPLSVWQTKDAPRFLAGYIYIVIASVIELLMLPIPVYFERRDRKKGLYDVIEGRNADHSIVPSDLADSLSMEEGSIEKKQEAEVKVDSL